MAFSFDNGDLHAFIHYIDKEQLSLPELYSILYAVASDDGDYTGHTGVSTRCLNVASLVRGNMDRMNVLMERALVLDNDIPMQHVHVAAKSEDRHMVSTPFGQREVSRSDLCFDWAQLLPADVYARNGKHRTVDVYSVEYRLIETDASWDKYYIPDVDDCVEYASTEERALSIINWRKALDCTKICQSRLRVLLDAPILAMPFAKLTIVVRLLLEQTYDEAGNRVGYETMWDTDDMIEATLYGDAVESWETCALWNYVNDDIKYAILSQLGNGARYYATVSKQWNSIISSLEMTVGYGGASALFYRWVPRAAIWNMHNVNEIAMSFMNQLTADAFGSTRLKKISLWSPKIDLALDAMLSDATLSVNIWQGGCITDIVSSLVTYAPNLKELKMLGCVDVEGASVDLDALVNLEVLSIVQETEVSVQCTYPHIQLKTVQFTVGSDWSLLKHKSLVSVTLDTEDLSGCVALESLPCLTELDIVHAGRDQDWSFLTKLRLKSLCISESFLDGDELLGLDGFDLRRCVIRECPNITNLFFRARIWSRVLMISVYKCRLTDQRMIRYMPEYIEYLSFVGHDNDKQYEFRIDKYPHLQQLYLYPYGIGNSKKLWFRTLTYRVVAPASLCYGDNGECYVDRDSFSTIHSRRWSVPEGYPFQLNNVHSVRFIDGVEDPLDIDYDSNGDDMLDIF